MSQPPGFQPQDQRRAIALIVVACAVGLVALVLVGMIAYRAVERATASSADSLAPQSTQNSPSTSAGRPTTAAPVKGGLPGFVAPSDLGHCTYTAKGEPAKKLADGRSQLPKSDTPIPTQPATVTASMKTSQGNIGLELDNAKAPCTVNSFASLAQGMYFDDTVCHRMTSGGLSVLQCGDPTGTGTGGPGYEFANEYPTNQYKDNDPTAQQPVNYPAGTLAMANAGPGTNGSQFFMVYKDSLLPPQYTVFGRLDKTGMDTLAKIAQNGVDGGGTDGKPAQEVKIIDLQLD